MDRLQMLLRGIDKSQLGIEVAPWMNPVAPKRSGYNALALDVFSTEVLRATAAEDPNIPDEAIANIEEVDIVGSADKIAAYVTERNLDGKVDYILSSHNFEHLPNPIIFLQGCAAVLKDGGVVSMALPDYRTCFDYFRPFTTTAEFIGAYFSDCPAPTAEQFFMQNSRHCRFFHNDGRMDGSFSLDMDVRQVKPLPGLRGAFESWNTSRQSPSSDHYRDTHCWAFSPSSFALIIGDLIHLELIDLELLDVSHTIGNEFFVRLKKSRLRPINDDAFYERRLDLMHASKDEAAENTQLVQNLRRQIGALIAATS